MSDLGTNESNSQKNDILDGNKKFLARVFSYIEERPDTDNAAILRYQIGEAFDFLGGLVKLKAKANSVYRLAKKEAEGKTNSKGDGRKAFIEGETSNEKYAMDIIEGCLETIQLKLKSSSDILFNLTAENKRMST